MKLESGAMSLLLAMIVAILATMGCGNKNPCDGVLCQVGTMCVDGDCVPVDFSVDPDAPDDTTGDTGGDTMGDTPADTILDPDVPDDGTDIPDVTTCTVDGDCPDDGNPCTEARCDTGTCVYIPVGGLCDDGVYCNGLDYCHEGECQAGEPPVCDDFNPCTSDECQETVPHCVATPLGEGSFCDNEVACDGTDECDAEGDCLPTYDLVCNDGNPCTTDTCTEESGGCVNTLDPPEDIVADCGSNFGSYIVGYGDNMFDYSCGGTPYTGHYADSAFKVTLTSPGTLSISLTLDPADETNYEIFILTDGCDPASCVAHGTTSASASGLAAGDYWFVIERDRIGACVVNVSCT